MTPEVVESRIFFGGRIANAVGISKEYHHEVRWEKSLSAENGNQNLDVTCLFERHGTFLRDSCEPEAHVTWDMALMTALSSVML